MKISSKDLDRLEKIADRLDRIDAILKDLKDRTARLEQSRSVFNVRSTSNLTPAQRRENKARMDAYVKAYLESDRYRNR